MSAEHTPTPWRLSGQAQIRTDIGHSPSDEWIGSVHWRNRAANAEFIVRAVNAHDDLVAALKEADAWLDATLGMVERGDGPPNWDGIREHRIVIRAALAKAEAGHE